MTIDSTVYFHIFSLSKCKRTDLLSLWSAGLPVLSSALGPPDAIFGHGIRRPRPEPFDFDASSCWDFPTSPRTPTPSRAGLVATVLKPGSTPRTEREQPWWVLSPAGGLVQTGVSPLQHALIGLGIRSQLESLQIAVS